MEHESQKKSGPSNLVVRLLTTVVLAPLLLLLLIGGPDWAWAALVCLAAGQATRELLAMTHPTDALSRWAGAATTCGLSAALYWGDDPRIAVTALLVTVVLSALLPLLRPGEIATAALRTLGGLASPIYVGVLLVTLALLRRNEGSSFVALALLIAWMGDTGGYVFGRLWGKTKLYEAISPKKTREGLVGSVVFSTASAVGAGLTFLPDLPLVHGAALGVLGAILGMAGDLFESLLKRSTGVKDSGTIIPGHGGLFDRIDALLMVGPLVYVYTLWF